MTRVCRLRDDFGPSRLVSRRPANHGIGHGPHALDAPRCSLEREVGPADDPARGEGVAGPGRVDHLRDHERTTVVVLERAPTRAALEDPRSAGQLPAEHLVLRLVREDDVRLERLHECAEPFGAGVPDRTPGGQVDAHAGAGQACKVDGSYRGPRDRLGKKRIAGDVEVVTDEPRRSQLARLEAGRDPAVGEHRPFPVTFDQRHDHAVAAGLDGAHQFDAQGFELLGREPSLGVRRALAQPSGGAAQHG